VARRADRRRPLSGLRIDELPWSEAELAEIAERLAPVLEAGGVALGAFAGDRLVGAAVLGGERFGSRLELAFLYVDAAARGRGAATALLDEVCRRARARGAAQLYVSASDTESSIGFYLDRGWRPADPPEAALAAGYPPSDIGLTLDLMP
jgi:GNAT superfamily N-acetyltransferase